MPKFKKKFEMYRHLQANIANIYAEARKASDEIGIPPEIRGKFGLTGAISGCPSPLTKKVREAVEKGSTEVIPLAKLVDEIRAIVKDVYGDEYDAAPINTCEAGLWVTFDVLFTPPMQGRGDNYLSRYIIPYEKHLHHHGGYGRPYPPRFKDIFADRGCTAGELGFYGKRQNNLSVHIVPLVGADYSVHGIKYHPAILLTKVDPEASAKKIKEAAQRNAFMLAGITSLAYDTPGYGYGVKDADGTPALQKKLAEIAHEFDVPYVLDNAWGVPFIGHDIRKSGADVIIYSMDKASESTTAGLIIGKEEYMVPIRRALGYHGDRYGTTASYGKAAYVTNDPGKEALLGVIAALKELRENPEELTKPVDDLYEIVKEEFENIHPKIKKGLIISKSYNSRAVEVNYENTWNGEELGLPIFTIEDMYAGTNILQSGMSQMGVIPTVAYDANIMISPGLGTTDDNGQIIEDRARLAVRALVRLIEIVAKYSGYID
ncbi:hypothetical protein SAMN05660826_01825 [Caldanaerovirga acetigignens]|jgi:hypothetical protein|uniref:Uncharacterized protein n=1 Tax=Caldanaerovirga acetigignens TaxID=447595 RepID=A0A1M7LAC5_9FIRM|nr:hypothetical protein [Caldanaerovirga acetigignens]SHM74350.1 hypothetical protein SAMN05660826_01825 [Caldanaerovirga acetigignens]